MDVGCDFSDIDRFIEREKQKVVEEMGLVGEEAVMFAIEHGDYQNRTYNLRTSNEWKADETGLTLFNDADYASYVEAKGFEVLSGAALFAEKKLKEKFE